jgi:hypothetical protein
MYTFSPKIFRLKSDPPKLKIPWIHKLQPRFLAGRLVAYGKLVHYDIWSRRCYLMYIYGVAIVVKMVKCTVSK